AAQSVFHGLRLRIWIAVDRHIAQFQQPRFQHRLRPAIRIFHRIEFDHAGRRRHVIRVQGPDLGADPLLNTGTDTFAAHDYCSPFRYSAERACAVSDSPRASIEATPLSCAAPAGEQWMME